MAMTMEVGNFMAAPQMTAAESGGTGIATDSDRFTPFNILMAGTQSTYAEKYIILAYPAQ